MSTSSTVSRGKAITLPSPPAVDRWAGHGAEVRFGNSLCFYDEWPAPDVIVSDGAYGVFGFEGDTSDHLGIPDWYRPHVTAWAARAKSGTTLWFWNSEIGWAAAHPVLEQCGFRYVNANIWNKGVAHIAGNVNTTKIRRFPVVTDVPRFALTLPIARLDVFAALVRLYRDGRMASLLLHREYEMLVLRFGLDDLQAPVYRTLLEVGERLDNLRGDGGVTRERARQLEESALSKLGIVDD